MSGIGQDPNVSSDPRYNPIFTAIAVSSYQILGVINEDETPTAGQFQIAFRAVNSMMKELEATGIHVWTEEEAILFLQPLQARYLLGSPNPKNPTTDHACDAFQYAQTTLPQAVAAGSFQIPLLDPTGFDVGDQIGVGMDSGYTFWSTIASITGSTATMSTAITGAASINNFTQAYLTDIVRPLRVPFTRRLQFQDQIITPVRMMSRQEYFNLPNQGATGQVSVPPNSTSATGTPTQAYYNPARDQGQYFVWPVPNAGQLLNCNAMRFTYYRPINDFTSPASTADLPSEWTNALEWNLAKELMPRFSVPAERYDRIMAAAGAKLELVMGWDREIEDIYFGVDMSEAVRR